MDKKENMEESPTEKKVVYFPVLVDNEGSLSTSCAQDYSELNTKSKIRVLISQTCADTSKFTVNKVGLDIPECKPIPKLDEIIHNFDNRLRQFFDFINHAFADLDTNGARYEDIVKLSEFKVSPEEWKMLRNFGKYNSKQRQNKSTNEVTEESSKISVYFQKYKN